MSLAKALVPRYQSDQELPRKELFEPHLRNQVLGSSLRGPLGEKPVGKLWDSTSPTLTGITSFLSFYFMLIGF